MNENYLIELPEKEYIKSYDDAIVKYNNIAKDIKSFEKNQLTESHIQPMHPNMYYQLIQVKGFTELNGYTYYLYIDKWKSRCNC